MARKFGLQDFRCVVASLREAILKGISPPLSLTLFYESALMPAMKEGDARWGPACFAFLFTAVPVSTEVAVSFFGDPKP